MAAARLPEGIEEKHVLKRHGSLAGAVPLLVLTVVMAAALLGAFGGTGPDRLRAESPEAELTVSVPLTLRSGVFFEMGIRVSARNHLDDAVIAVDPALWRDMTINTVMPGSAEEAFEDGLFRFHYGSLDAGQRLELKIDGQVNPDLFAGTGGEVELLDGKRTLVTVPVKIKVLP